MDPESLVPEAPPNPVAVNVQLLASQWGLRAPDLFWFGVIAFIVITIALYVLAGAFAWPVALVLCVKLGIDAANKWKRARRVKRR